MRFHRTVIVGVVLLLAGACNGGDGNDSAPDIFSGSIGADEVNRFEMEFVGAVNFSHTSTQRPAS